MNFDCSLLRIVRIKENLPKIDIKKERQRGIEIMVKKRQIKEESALESKNKFIKGELYVR